VICWSAIDWRYEFSGQGAVIQYFAT
jgi:hypothetical protein